MTRRTALLILVTLASACSHAPPRTVAVVQQGAPVAPARHIDPGLAISPAELRPLMTMGPDQAAPVRNAEGDVVFIGSGPADDKEAIALLPLNPQGRILVMVVTTPAGKPRDAATKHAQDQAMVMRIARAMS